MLCPTLRSEQDGAGALDEHTQITISALRDAAKDRAITGRHLFRHQAKPRGKVSPFCKGSSIVRPCNLKPQQRDLTSLWRA